MHTNNMCQKIRSNATSENSLLQLHISLVNYSHVFDFSFTGDRNDFLKSCDTNDQEAGVCLVNAWPPLISKLLSIHTSISLLDTPITKWMYGWITVMQS